MVNVFSSSGLAGLTALMMLGLSGCGAVESMTRSSSAEPSAQSSSSTTTSLAPPPRRCPAVVINEEDAIKRVYARGEDGNPKAIIYQAVIFETGRECASFDRNFEFRTGVRGRVTAGAMAQPGQSITLNIVLTFGDSETTLWQTVRQVPVTLDPTQGSVEFSFIEENGSVLLPEGADEFDYQIKVGFAPERR